MTQRRRRGFTLLDLMITVTLTSILALAAMAVISGIVTAQRRGDAAATAVNGLRDAAAVFERDVRGATSVEVTPSGVRLAGATWRLSGGRLLRGGTGADEIVLRNVTAFCATHDAATEGGTVRATITLAPVADETRGPAVVAVACPRIGDPR